MRFGLQVNTYTIEVSMLGYEDHDSRQIIPYTDDLYAKVSSDHKQGLTKLDQVGRNITRAFWDYYKIVAVIPLEVWYLVYLTNVNLCSGLVRRRMRDPEAVAGLARSAEVCGGHPELQHGPVEGGGKATAADCADL